MALRQVRIGSLPDVFQYDDGDFGSAIVTDHFIKTTQAPVAAEDVLRLGDIPSASAELLHSDANIGDNKAVRGDGGARGVQDSNVDISDSGSISLPAGETVDGRDVSADGAKLDGLLATIVIYNNNVICHNDEVVTHEV